MDVLCTPLSVPSCCQRLEIPLACCLQPLLRRVRRRSWNAAAEHHDIDGGHQPVHNEDGTVWVVFNGEIYNFKTLRQLLERQGHRFYTDTDTEVIVHLYEQYGEACVDKLRGMFAFAVWDSRRKSLLLARDRLGIKPLFYTIVDDRLAFGSELKVLLQLPEVERKLNWSSVNHLFTTMCTPGSESIVEGVHKLKPGHVLTASA